MGELIKQNQPHWDHERIPNKQGCDSTGAVQVYEDGSACCFKCMTQLFPNPKKYNYFDFIGESKSTTSGFEDDEDDFADFDDEPTPKGKGDEKFLRRIREYEAAKYKPFPDRGISVSTAKFFGVKTDMAGNVFYPFYSKSTKELCGLKIRSPDKQFIIVGKVVGEDVLLFGAQKFKGGGKYCTTHEGEFDAMAGYEMNDSRFANISVPNGAASALKAIKFNIDYLEAFDKNVLAFDGDEPGRKAQQKCAPIFEPGTCLLMNYPEDQKDACEFSANNAGGIWKQLFWEASTYTPAGIVNLADDFESLFTRENRESIPSPWEGYDKKTRGFRYKELVTLTSGSGMGKSTVTRALCNHFLDSTDDNIGVLFLEEDKDRTRLGLMGYHIGLPLHLNEVFNETPREKIKEAFDATVGSGRMYAFNHFGSTQIDELLGRIRYLIKGLDCKWIILDHLSIVVSGIEGDDERKMIDVAMTKLRTLVEETGVGLILVSHLKRKGDGKAHEDGGQISLSHLRGSQAIAQLSDIVIGLERNQQTSDPILRNLTLMRILKNRYTGETGLATHLLYNLDTGRLAEVTPEDLEFMDADGSEDDDF